MNKYLLTIALISFSTVCVSAVNVPSKLGSVLSMAGCTKAEKQKEDRKEDKQKEEPCCESGRTTKKQPWTIRNGYTLNSYTPASDEVAGGRKSAAQKLMEGY